MCRRKACGMLILCKLFLSAIIKFTEKKKKKTETAHVHGPYQRRPRALTYTVDLRLTRGESPQARLSQTFYDLSHKRNTTRPRWQS